MARARIAEEEPAPAPVQNKGIVDQVVDAILAYDANFKADQGARESDQDYFTRLVRGCGLKAMPEEIFESLSAEAQDWVNVATKQRNALVKNLPGAVPITPPSDWGAAADAEDDTPDPEPKLPEEDGEEAEPQPEPEEAPKPAGERQHAGSAALARYRERQAAEKQARNGGNGAAPAEAPARRPRAAATPAPAAAPRRAQPAAPAPAEPTRRPRAAAQPEPARRPREPAAAPPPSEPPPRAARAARAPRNSMVRAMRQFIIANLDCSASQVNEHMKELGFTPELSTIASTLTFTKNCVADIKAAGHWKN